LRRRRATHLLNSYSYSEDGTDDYGSPIKEKTQDISAEQVRLIEPSRQFVTSESGERLEENPKVVGSLYLYEEIDEGHEVELLPLEDQGSSSRYEVLSVKINRGRGRKSSTTTLELEDI